MTIDISTLWDFSDPASSEERFRGALAAASTEEALILQTQIARTYGLRGDFNQAQEILAEIEADVVKAGPEVQARYWLELGRTWASAAHPPEAQTEDARERAREAFLKAHATAKDAALDDLAIDALHMMSFVDTEPERQLEWDLEALATMEASTQADAKRWEGSLRNNVGYALHLLGRYEEALEQFELALARREREGNARNVRIAFWMIAWTYRAMGRLQEALEVQSRLEKEWDAAGEADPYVYEELEHIFRALGDEGRASHYAARLAETRPR